MLPWESPSCHRFNEGIKTCSLQSNVLSVCKTQAQANYYLSVKLHYTHVCTFLLHFYQYKHGEAIPRRQLDLTQRNVS